MNIQHFLITNSIRGLSRFICRVNDQQLHRVPASGPLIIACNHVNFLDVPVLFTHLLPRPITGFAKKETWDNPTMGYLFNLWGAIPIRRGEPDISALRKAIEALNSGKIVAIAPEGTRSGHGRLGPGYGGITLIALQTGAPILPIVYYGHESYKNNLTRLRRTDFQIVVGNPFYLKKVENCNRDVRKQMLDEIMYQLAALLPPSYRGYYSDLHKATKNYLHFPLDSLSNLSRN